MIDPESFSDGKLICLIHLKIFVLLFLLRNAT